MQNRLTIPVYPKASLRGCRKHLKMADNVRVWLYEKVTVIEFESDLKKKTKPTVNWCQTPASSVNFPIQLSRTLS